MTPGVTEAVSSKMLPGFGELMRMVSHRANFIVIPAKTGIQCVLSSQMAANQNKQRVRVCFWIPAFAGMTR
jgi:molybdopterin biosynthesis enzyme MoaB